MKDLSIRFEFQGFRIKWRVKFYKNTLYEQKLVDRCRFLNEELDQQKTNLASIDEQDFPTPDQIKNSSEPVNEVLVLRQKLMKQMNNLEIYEEKNQELQYAIEAHTEHKRLLNLEKDRQPDPVQLEKQQEQFQQEIITDEKYLNLLKKQRIQTENEIKKIEQDIKEQHLCLEKAIEKQDFVTAEIVKNSTVDGMHPAELNRVIDKLGKLESQLQANNKRMDEEVSVLKSELDSKSQDSAVIQEQHDALRKTLKEADMKNENKEREFGTLKADFNRDKYRETELLSKKEDLEIKSRLLDQEKASIHEQISRRKREYDRDSRNLKKKILQLNIMKDQLVDLNSQLTKTQAEVDNYPTDENESERKDLATEVENLKKKKLSEEAKATGEQEAWENLIETINKLSKEQEQERSVVNEQERILHMKSDEREMKAREVARAKARLKNILEDIQGADLESTDQKKRLKELNTSQDNFAKRYEQIKNEKNKYVNLIQSSSQKREELKAKLRIKKNEIEILQERLNDKEKELAKKTLKNQVAETQRDQKQAQINKAKNEKNILETELDTIKLECSKLTTMNTFLEDEMLKLRGIYESAVSFRNQRGVQLIEREEEVCVFYEKLNIQDSVIRKGDVKLEELNDEVEFLKIQVQEEQRQIDILKKHRPELSDLKTELVELQNELRRVQDKTVELEQKLETPELCSTRIRELGGEDLKPDKLESKLAQLELRLAQKEEQSLEKSLILEQVERLVHNIEGDQGRNIDDKRSLVEQCTHSL